MGLLEPINTRVTDPRYFLDTPQQGRTPAPRSLLPFASGAAPGSHHPSRFLCQRLPSCRKWGDPTSSYKW